MSKFSNPFGENKEVFLNQTYHGSSNTAIDCYGTKYIANLPVYAIADGKVGNYYRGGGSYISQYPDNSDLRIWYVHIYNCVANGSYVKKGQKIGEIAPKSVNGGYPEHLHLGLTPKGKYLMDYFDRSIPFRTRYKDIKASWFKSDGLLNWSKFKNLSYTNNDMGKVIKGKKYEFSNTDGLNVRDIPNGNIVVQLKEKKKCVGLALTNSISKDKYNWNLYVGVNWAGWIAENWSKETSREITDISGKVAISPEEPDCKKYIEQIDTLNKEIEGLKMGLGSLEELLEDKDKQLGIISNELKLANERIELLEENIRNYEETEKQLEGELKKAQNEARVSEKDKLACQVELSIYKGEKWSWLIELLSKLFPKKE